MCRGFSWGKITLNQLKTESVNQKKSGISLERSLLYLQKLRQTENEINQLSTNFNKKSFFIPTLGDQREERRGKWIKAKNHFFFLIPTIYSNLKIILTTVIHCYPKIHYFEFSVKFSDILNFQAWKKSNISWPQELRSSTIYNLIIIELCILQDSPSGRTSKRFLRMFKSFKEIISPMLLGKWTKSFELKSYQKIITVKKYINFNNKY